MAITMMKSVQMTAEYLLLTLWCGFCYYEIKMNNKIYVQKKLLQAMRGKLLLGKNADFYFFKEMMAEIEVRKISLQGIL